MAVVEQAMAFGLTIEQIAQLIINPATKMPIDVRTLHKHFQVELDRGYPEGYRRCRPGALP